MGSALLATEAMAVRYMAMFANRLAYTIQSPRPHRESGKYYYYRPKGTLPLSPTTIRRHLEGEITIALYAINPETQRCKWVAIDADYGNALEDLLKLQWELRRDGVEAALEKSRRGGHLWIFAQQPLLARDCRRYISHLAQRLKVPLKGAGPADGIEIFPKQDMVHRNEFGNAIRAPLGVHRGAGKRYWFYGASYNLEAQMTYLSRLKRITAEELATFVSGLKTPAASAAMPSIFVPRPAPRRQEFRILDHVAAKRRQGRNYWTRCPSCARQGHDRSGDNLAICAADPRKYRCWAGCTKEMIRAALGCPIRRPLAS